MKLEYFNALSHLEQEKVLLIERIAKALEAIVKQGEE